MKNGARSGSFPLWLKKSCKYVDWELPLPCEENNLKNKHKFAEKVRERSQESWQYSSLALSKPSSTLSILKPIYPLFSQYKLNFCNPRIPTLNLPLPDAYFHLYKNTSFVSLPPHPPASKTIICLCSKPLGMAMFEIILFRYLIFWWLTLHYILP